VEQYTSELDWEARIMLENCQAIKCPSIDYHLTTFKKFQQAFCKQEVLKDILAKVNITSTVE
jgi:glutathione synthase